MTETTLLNTRSIEGTDYALYPVERTVESVRTLADLGSFVLVQQVYEGTDTPYTMFKSGEAMPVAPHIGTVRLLGETAAYFQIDKAGGVPAAIAFGTVHPVDAPPLEYNLFRAEIIG